MALIPGETENNESLELFSSKGYYYTKMLVYIIAERKPLDTDYMRNNKKIKFLIKKRLEYKIPLLILLTHCDNYCDEVKKTDINWKKTCKDHINNNNKTSLLSYLNQLIEKENSDFNLDEDDILHIVLIDPKAEEKQLSEEEILKSLPEDLREIYKNQDEKGKDFTYVERMIIKMK